MEIRQKNFLGSQVTKTELAKLLNISRRMVYKLRNKGMPTSGLEAAQIWRDHHLNPRRTKSWKDFVTEVKRINRPWLENN